MGDENGCRSLDLPREGLREVTKLWAGGGDLIDLLAMTYDDNTHIRWPPEDIRNRSYRILLGKVEEAILRLPSSLTEWEQYLPISVLAEKRIESNLQGKVLWSETRRKYGWPPNKYILQSRTRSVSNVAVSAIRWFADQLGTIVNAVNKISPIITDPVQSQVEALMEVAQEYIWLGFVDEPDRFELHALKSSGEPWRSIAEAAEHVIASKRSPEYLAFDLLEADSELQPSLFQLTTFGYLISALKSQRFSLESMTILHGSQDQPQVKAIHPDGGEWDLWYEARQMRSEYKVKHSAYRTAVRGINYAERSIGYDVLLILPRERALILECKWSGYPVYVGRDGFHQASSYALDAKNGLAKDVWSFVVGPEEIVPHVSIARDLENEMSIVLGSTSVTGLSQVLEMFLYGDAEEITCRNND